jgi:hypothetical protein
MKDQIGELVIRILREIAPEADLGNFRPDVSFRDQFDFESVDCLKLATLNGCVEYLKS